MKIIHLRVYILKLETKKVIGEKTSTIKYIIANRFTYNRYINIYNKRYQRSESINGYHKRSETNLTFSFYQ
jgi:hypothetical protein